MTFKNKITALKWWRELKDSEQQRLADKYHHNDDFTLTHQNNERIEQIYLKEHGQDKE